jgi:cell cycle sensor histidine kinase DivJ
MAGFCGICASLAFFWLVGPPGPLAIMAFVWLIAPLLIALLPRFGVALDTAHLFSVVNLTLLITFLAALSGGLSSFLIAWLLIIPFEATLSGRKRVIFSSLFLSCAAVGLLALLGLSGLLPVSRIPADNWMTLFGSSTIAAIFYAGALAITVQRTYQKMELEAERGESKYRFLADHALDMIIRHRSDGSLSFVSPASELLLGYAPDAIISMPPGALIHRADRKSVELALASASQSGNDTSIEFRMQHKDGHYIWMEMRCHPVMTEDQTGREIIAVARDISVSKSNEENLVSARDEAETANEAKSRFLANISHELRTPLNAIIGFSDMMKQKTFGPLGDVHYEDYAQLINESGEHLLELINDLLDMSKIEAGKYNLKCESFFIPQVIENCIRLVHLQAKRAGVRLQVELPESLPHIKADPRACRQILLNLLSNALKFTPSGGTVTLGARMEAGMMVLEVRDNGVGIPPVTLEKLGRPFEQGESLEDTLGEDALGEGASGRAEAGTGLGLALVRSLANMHGGEMDIASRLGEGTVVLVFLPLVAKQAPKSDEPMFEEVERLVRESDLQEDVAEPRQVQMTSALRDEESLEDLEGTQPTWPPLNGAA